MREPGYPYFLAGLRFLTDRYHDNAAIVANLVFTSLSAFLVSRLARMVSPVRWIALLAPILFLIHPGVLIAELRGGVEVPFVFLLLCFFLTLSHAQSSRTTPGYVRAGVLLGIVSCVRSTALPFPVFLFFKDLVLVRRWRPLARTAWHTAVVLACAALVLSPWIIRNYRLVGQFIPTASVQGVSMQAGNYICTHEDGRKGLQELDSEAAMERNRLAAARGYHFQAGYYQFFFDPHDEVDFSKFLTHQVMQQYVQSPSLFASCAGANALNFWFAGKNRAATIANLAVQLPYMILAAIGVVLIYRRDKHNAAMSLLLWFVVYTVLVYMTIHAQARYSVPLVPILAIFAAVPICRLYAHRTGVSEREEDSGSNAGISSAPGTRILP
jgi:hypothetical protein